MATATTIDLVRLHPADNVCIATHDLPADGRVLDGTESLALLDPIPLGHKVATQRIPAGEAVIRYGQRIGEATTEILPGAWVHTHNLTAGQLRQQYEFSTDVPEPPAPLRDRTFQGYRRADGRVGTRNYIAVISSVNCSASVSRYITDRFDRQLLAQYPHVDGLLPITHKGGCGLQFGGEDHDQLNRVLAGFAQHPNVGAFLLVGLGCETGAIGHLVQREQLVQLGAPRAERPPILNIQDCGGTQATVEAGIRAVAELLPRVNDVRRESVPASQLILGTECGGSDGNSGVTANPALGVASDLVVAAGGTTILAETPEIYGAEHLLTRRARTPEIGQQLLERIRWWEQYAGRFGVVLDNNPSPGNKAGGLTTIYEKSLGAIAKGGTTALEAVYRYAEPVRHSGFVIVDTPGYDPASVTGLVASGANIVCFTTGRGSCYGCKPVPSIKIATNTPMYHRMQDDMDLDAGVIISRGTPVAEVGQQIFELLLETASGRKTKSELHGLGEEEFAPWSIGPTL